MPTHVVTGYGKFGRMAVRLLHQELPAAIVLVIERDPTRLAVGLRPGDSAVVEDAVHFLAHATGLAAESVIIPTVPFHLAARFLLARIPEARQVSIPARLSCSAPHVHLLDASNLCCSRADFLCPDSCPEDDLCTVTGERRDPLFLELEELRIPGFSTVVLKSFQVLPGVGGYLYRDLCDLLHRARPGFNLVVTSCKCHGIITALYLRSDENS